MSHESRKPSNTTVIASNPPRLKSKTAVHFKSPRTNARDPRYAAKRMTKALIEDNLRSRDVANVYKTAKCCRTKREGLRDIMRRRTMGTSVGNRVASWLASVETSLRAPPETCRSDFHRAGLVRVLQTGHVENQPRSGRKGNQGNWSRHSSWYRIAQVYE